MIFEFIWHMVLSLVFSLIIGYCITLLGYIFLIDKMDFTEFNGIKDECCIDDNIFFIGHHYDNINFQCKTCKRLFELNHN